MHFAVGPFLYAVVVLGAGCRACYRDKAIYLGTDVPVSQRLEKLIHELWHCWMFHVPAPHTEEEQARMAETMMASFWRDLNRQGGEAALRKLKPQRPVRELVYVPCE